MPIAMLFLAIVSCVAAFFPSAMAQSAATGGTKDVAPPGMVFPIRPRDEPTTPTAVPNQSRRAPNVRVLPIYRYRYRVHR